MVSSPTAPTRRATHAARAAIGAVRNDAFVYAIAIDSPERQPINTRVNPTALQEITEDSGGRTEMVRSSAELAEATARIADELNSQYLLGYTSRTAADGQYHSIRVRVRARTTKCAPATAISRRHSGGRAQPLRLGRAKARKMDITRS